MIIKRCVPDQLEVETKIQPQQVEQAIKHKIGEKKSDEKNDEVETESAKEENVPQETLIEEEEVIEEESDERIKNCRVGNSLYTICANIKIGNERFTIQRIIEEKTEKLANIEYDRTIKKEFGKPKSVTKRTCKEYTTGDEEFCNKIEEVSKKVEMSEEEKELQEKLKILETGVIGMFKIEFAKNLYKGEPVYLFAMDLDDVERQLKTAIMESNYEDVNEGLKQIKSITKLSTFSIKTDKSCLKRLQRVTSEQLQELWQAAKDKIDVINGELLRRYNTLKENGFTFYACRDLPKGNIKFLEIARSDEEANLLSQMENRIFQAVLDGKKVTGVTMGEVDALFETARKKIRSTMTDEEIIGELVSESVKDGDIAHKVLFEYNDDSFLQDYKDFLNDKLKIMEQVKAGKGEEILQKKISDLGEKIQNIQKNENSLKKFLGMDNKVNFPINDNNIMKSLREFLK